MKEIISLIIVFVFVIGLAYFITKKLASLGALRMQSKNMKILETLQLGINQYIHLVKVGEKILIIGVSKDNISYLCEVDDKMIDLRSYNAPNDISLFEEYLKKLTPKRNNNI